MSVITSNYKFSAASEGFIIKLCNDTETELMVKVKLSLCLNTTVR